MTEGGNYQLIDTIAAMQKIPDMDVSLFPGRSESVNADTGKVYGKWYRNDDGKPRITYYPASGWLRVEWSAQQHDTESVGKYLVRGLSLSTAHCDVRTWRCQRVDYCVEFSMVCVAPYIAALDKLRAGSMQRHPFPSGVVWKASNRWVKFYDAKKHGREGLRFEVSNYKDAVRYMAANWFGCERTVEEMVQPGRALYVVGKYWQKLGLHRGFAAHEHEVARLRGVYGQRSLAGAIHALSSIRSYGVESYKSLMLMSKSSYYRWYKQLSDEGFLAASDSELSSLCLPCEDVFAHGAQNLKSASSPPTHTHLDKTAQKNVYKNLGVKPGAPRVKYLEEQYRDWKSGYSLDAKPQEVAEKRPVINLSFAPASSAVGVVAVE